VGTIHDSNTCPKRVGDARWRRIPLERVRRLMGRGWPADAQPPAPLLEYAHG
jgi:hypothetical protein